MKINVYHNVAQDYAGRPLGMLDGYEITHELALVATVQVAEERGVQYADSEHAEAMFHLFNVGDDPEYGTPDPIAQEYRFRGNRSLSVGDVVEIDGRAYAVGRVGYRRIPESVDLIVVDFHDHGTNSIMDEKV
jgi:hypothetical protein